MALLYAYQDTDSEWHGEPDSEIDDKDPTTGRLTIIDPRSPFVGQTLKVRLASMEGSGIGSYVVLDNGYRLCATTCVEQLLFPWTKDEPFHGTHPSAGKAVPNSISQYTLGWEKADAGDDEG